MGITSWKRIAAAQRGMEKLASQERDWAADQFLASVSDPPSARIHVRGGRLWQYWDQVAWLIPSGTADLSNPVNVYGSAESLYHGPTENYVVTFATPGHYRIFTLDVKMPYDAANGMEFRLIDPGTTTEYATAGEAEAYWNGDNDWYLVGAPVEGFPVCGLVLRSDPAGTLLPIDRVNRGRSYVYPPDIRPIDYMP